MAGLDLTDGVKKLFLAGVGAVATGAEKSEAIIDELVKKGEITVEQGKALNEELTVKAKAAAGDLDGTMLRSKLEAMTAEERAAYAKKVAEIAADVEAKTTKVDVEDGSEKDAR